jgi:hypothetical protein
MTCLPSLLGELPKGWKIVGGRPHPLLEAEKHLSETKIHVLVGRDRAEVIRKIEAAEAEAAS